MIRLLFIAAILLVTSWAVLLLLARRLPQGAAKDLATVLPACATTARRLRKDPRVPAKAKLAVAFAGLWVLSPIDLIPEFLPIIGPPRRRHRRRPRPALRSPVRAPGRAVRSLARRTPPPRTPPPTPPR